MAGLLAIAGAIVACGDDGPRGDGLTFGPGDSTTPVTTVETGDVESSSGAGSSSGSASTTIDPSSTSSTGTDGVDESSEGTTAPSEPFMMLDSLREGGTMGTAVGGSFGPDGWTVTGIADRIYWPLPRLVEGSVEFTVANVTHANLPLNDHEIFAMYEGGYDIEHPIGYNPEFRVNDYKCMIRVYGTAEKGRVGQQKLMWGLCPGGAPGYGENGCACGSGFFEEPFGGDGSWDGTPQRMRVEWGAGQTRLLRNGVEVMPPIDWSASGNIFGPQELYLSIGTPRPEEVGTAGMPIGAIFSDVTVEGITGPIATCN